MKRKPQAPNLQRRLLQRSLVIVIVMLCVFVGWSVKWLNDRHGFIAEQRVLLKQHGVSNPGEPRISQARRGACAPFPLWLIGEEGISFMGALHVGRARNGREAAQLIDHRKYEEAFAHAKAFFPEATVVVAPTDGNALRFEVPPHEDADQSRPPAAN